MRMPKFLTFLYGSRLYLGTSSWESSAIPLVLEQFWINRSSRYCSVKLPRTCSFLVILTLKALTELLLDAECILVKVMLEPWPPLRRLCRYSVFRLSFISSILLCNLVQSTRFFSCPDETKIELSFLRHYGCWIKLEIWSFCWDVKYASLRSFRIFISRVEYSIMISSGLILTFREPLSLFLLLRLSGEQLCEKSSLSSLVEL